MTDLIRLSLEQSIELQGSLRRNNVSLAELKKLTSGDNLRRAIDLISPKLQYRSIALPEMEGKLISEVLVSLKKVTLASIPDDLNELPEKMKDGMYHFFFKKIHRSRGFGAEVIYARWYGGEWSRKPCWLGNDWSSNSRVVLVEK